MIKKQVGAVVEAYQAQTTTHLQQHTDEVKRYLPWSDKNKLTSEVYRRSTDLKFASDYLISKEDQLCNSCCLCRSLYEFKPKSSTQDPSIGEGEE